MLFLKRLWAQAFALTDLADDTALVWLVRADGPDGPTSGAPKALELQEFDGIRGRLDITSACHALGVAGLAVWDSRASGEAVPLAVIPASPAQGLTARSARRFKPNSREDAIRVAADVKPNSREDAIRVAADVKPNSREDAIRVATGRPAMNLKVAATDTQMLDAGARVSRLLLRGETIGTCVRLKGGLVIAARHCVVLEGRCLEGISAFGGELKFIGAKPDIDIAVFRGTPGPFFQLASSDVHRGQQVHLLSHPLDLDFEPKLQGGNGLAIEAGHVSQVCITGRFIIASFSTGISDSSGGAVLTDTRKLAGMYTGIGSYESSPEGGSSGGASSGGGANSGGSHGSRPPTTIERDPNNLWDDCLPDPVEAEASGDSMAAQPSGVNISHKRHRLPLFVPATQLMRCLVDLGLTGQDPLDAALDMALGHWGRRMRLKAIVARQGLAEVP